MSTPEVRLVPPQPEHVDAWIAIRAGATSRRLVAMDDDSRERLLERLFSLPELQRIWLSTSAENLASQAVARKLGFTLEGVLRGHLVIQGRRVDQQVWGLFRSEWESRSPR